MELAYVSDAYIPSRSASSIQIAHMCEAFSQNSCQVKLLAPPTNNGEMDLEGYYGLDEQMHFLPVPRPEIPRLETLNILLNNIRLAKTVTSLRPDLIYGRALIALWFAAREDIPIVYEAHAPFKERSWGRIQQLVFSRLVKQESFHRLVVISENLESRICSEYPELSDKIIVAPDGAKPPTNTKPINIGSEDKLKVGYIGHLYPGRGLELIGELASSCPWADFHIIGGDEEAVTRWENRFSMKENITFHGFVPPKEVARYQCGCDVLLAPYQHNLETRGGMNSADWMSPLKIFEYMAAGKPIIASDLPAIREVLIDDQTAILCEPDELNQWINALSKLFANSNLRREFGETAKNHFLNYYTWDQRAKKILNRINVPS